jgi:hypothetical protein
VLKNAQTLLAPLVETNALLMETTVLSLLLEIRFALTALSHKMNATKVIPATHRQVITQMASALLQTPNAVLLLLQLKDAPLLNNVKSMVQT